MNQFEMLANYKRHLIMLVVEGHILQINSNTLGVHRLVYKNEQLEKLYHRKLRYNLTDCIFGVAYAEGEVNADAI